MKGGAKLYDRGDAWRSRPARWGGGSRLYSWVGAGVVPRAVIGSWAGSTLAAGVEAVAAALDTEESDGRLQAIFGPFGQA